MGFWLVYLYDKAMRKFYLVRHGQNEDNANGILNGHRDLPLTELGVGQAHEIADKIQETGVVFDIVYSSPLQRAYKTAEIISDQLDLPKPKVLPALIERDFGIMTGQPYSRIVEMCAPNILQAELITYFLSPAGAETFPQLLERAKKLLTDLTMGHQAGSILLVTHGDLGKMIYAAYYNLSWKEVLTLFHFGNSDLLELSPESSSEDPHVHKIFQRNI